MLTPLQCDEFHRRGFVRIPSAFSTTAAAAMEERVWASLSSRFGVSRDDRTTWKLPHGLGLQNLKRHAVFQPIGSSSTIGALDELLGEERWEKPREWGQFCVTFPDESATRWTVPARSWHTDWPYVAPATGPRGALVLSFLTRVPPGHGGTVVVENSPLLISHFVGEHPWVARERMSVARKAFLDSDPWLRTLKSETDASDRVERFVRKESRIGDVGVRVAELTGESGDIAIGHPWMLHAASLNCGDWPRMMRVQRIRA